MNKVVAFCAANLSLGMGDFVSIATNTLKPHESAGMALADYTLGLIGETTEVISAVREFYFNTTDAKLDDLSPAARDKVIADSYMDIIKECGDVLWYAAALYHCSGCKKPLVEFETHQGVSEYYPIYGISIANSALYAAAIQLSVLGGEVSEYMKHVLMHGEEQKEDVLVGMLDNIILSVAVVLSQIKIPLRLCAELNSTKLAHRHQGKYNAEASATRHAKENNFKDTEAYKSVYSFVLEVINYVEE